MSKNKIRKSINKPYGEPVYRSWMEDLENEQQIKPQKPRGESVLRSREWSTL